MRFIRTIKTDNCFCMPCAEFVRRASSSLVYAIVANEKTIIMPLGYKTYHFPFYDLAQDVSFLLRAFDVGAAKHNITLFFDNENVFCGFTLQEAKRKSHMMY